MRSSFARDIAWLATTFLRNGFCPLSGVASDRRAAG